MERERDGAEWFRGGTMPNNGRIQLQFREGGPFKETGGGRSLHCQSPPGALSLLPRSPAGGCRLSARMLSPPALDTPSSTQSGYKEQ